MIKQLNWWLVFMLVDDDLVLMLVNDVVISGDFH